MTSAVRESHYAFQGVRIRASGYAEAVNLLDSRLYHFVSRESGSVSIIIEFIESNAGAPEWLQRPSGEGRPIYDAPKGDIDYFPDTGELFIDYGPELRARCDISAGHVRFCMTPERGNAWLATHPLFTICFVELLKRRDYFNIHASAVARNGRAILFAGPSGAGKTTSAIALLQAGFAFLGDDMQFLNLHAGRVRVLAFPDETDVTDTTLRMFPELGQTGSGLYSNRDKRSVRAEAIFRSDVTMVADPVLVLFPTVVPNGRTKLLRLTARESLLELAPNMLLTSKNDSQRHLNILNALAHQVDCYRLSIADEPSVVARLVAETFSSNQTAAE